jgi:hypothetical protein
VCEGEGGRRCRIHEADVASHDGGLDLALEGKYFRRNLLRRFGGCCRMSRRHGRRLLRSDSVDCGKYHQHQPPAYRASSRHVNPPKPELRQRLFRDVARPNGFE